MNLSVIHCISQHILTTHSPALHNILKATSENGVPDLVASHAPTDTKNNSGDGPAVIRNGGEEEAGSSKYVSEGGLKILIVTQ